MKSLHKLIFPGLAAAGLLFTTPAQALDCPTGAACTDPVGFITLNVKGSDGSSPQINLVGLGLFNPVEFQGTAVSSDSTTITTTTSALVAGEYDATDVSNPPYFVELVSGDDAGVIFDIASNDTDSVTLVQSLDGFAVSGETFQIRKHHTIGSVFGETDSGDLIADNNINNADTIQIFNPVTKQSTTYFFAPAFNGWVDSGFTPSNGVVLFPDQGILIRRKNITDAEVKLLGSVKTGIGALTLENGFSIVANIFPVDISLGDSGLFTGSDLTGVRANNNISLADTIRILDETTGNLSTFFYAPAFNSWVDAGFGNADDVLIKSGSSFILQRKADPITFLQAPPF